MKKFNNDNVDKWAAEYSAADEVMQKILDKIGIYCPPEVLIDLNFHLFNLNTYLNGAFTIFEKCNAIDENKNKFIQKLLTQCRLWVPPGQLEEWQKEYEEMK